MNTYSYTLEDSSRTDVSIHEFVAADTIQDAYKKVITIVNDLNAVNTEYVWQIRNIENSYFVGIDDRAYMHNHCCDDVCCEDDCYCDDSAPMAPQQDKCECECCK